jgi:enamine deaminase RidA (YjgF/YER057c/UK114 family)
MTPTQTGTLNLEVPRLSEGEREELRGLGLLSETGELHARLASSVREGHQPIDKRAMSAPEVLNEAYDYARPSSFSRGMRIDVNGVTILLISGTASVDEEGRTIHVGDFRAQTWRTFRNITKLLEAEGATWHDIVRTTCYLRDIERDYKDFNEVRTAFYTALGLDPLPASTGIQARICREDLLVEIEAIAMFQTACDT